MTTLHQRWWQLRMKWWQITRTHVLANEKKKALTLAPCSLSLVFRFISLSLISSPPLHYNYYFPHVRPQSLVSISFLHRGLRRRWDYTRQLKFSWAHRKAENYSRVEMDLSTQDRFPSPTSSHLSSTTAHIHYPFFLANKTDPDRLSAVLSLQVILQSVNISICTHQYSDAKCI